MKNRPGPKAKDREMQNVKFGRTITPRNRPHHERHPIQRPELFLLPDDIIRAANMKEVEATYRDMETLNLANLPYSHCIIGVPGRCIFFLTGDVTYDALTNTYKAKHENDKMDDLIKDFMSFEARFIYQNESFSHALVRINSLAEWRDTTHFKITPKDKNEMDKSIAKSALQLRKLLIVLLATKNTLQTRTKDKLVALGIGKNSHDPFRPIYTTTISISLPNEPQSSILIPGPAKRPHLRRGHIRQQKHGPRLCFTRAIWIEPQFINGDPETFQSTREAYNTSLPATTHI